MAQKIPAIIAAIHPELSLSPSLSPTTAYATPADIKNAIIKPTNIMFLIETNSVVTKN